MAFGGLPANSVARPALHNLNIEHFIYPNYDRFGGFCRSLKVFLRCYGHYQRFYPNFFNQMWTEYWTEMVNLFDLANDRRTKRLDLRPIYAELANEPIRMTAGISQMRQVEPKQVQNRCTIKFNQEKGGPEFKFKLDHTKRYQSGTSFSHDFTQKDFNGAIENGWVFSFTYAEKDKPDSTPINYNQSLPYYQIPAEGLRKLLKFGNTRLILFIEFKTRENNYIEQEVNAFHQHVIWYALQRRIQAFRAVPNNDTHIHKATSTKRSISYELNEIEPETRNAFWGTRPDMTQNDKIEGPVKYTDLQIGFQPGEELTSKRACTCNEFCNLNAFFHYNPIYRFLLVQHNRKFLRRRTLVANMYELAITGCLFKFDARLHPTPVSQLLDDVGQTLREYHIHFYKKPQLKDTWINAIPNGIDYEGITYMTLIDIDLSVRALTTYYRKPFDENGFINIEKCMEELYELHRRIGTYNKFVEQTNRRAIREWPKEFESRSHYYYFQYIEASIGIIMTDVNRVYENRLFIIDYERKGENIHEAEINQVTKWRGLQSKRNSLNLLFEIKPFTYLIDQLWLSFAKFKPMTALYSQRGLQNEYDRCKAIHDFIQQNMNNIQNTNTHKVRLNPSTIPTLFASPDLQNILPSFQLFYKLKLYSEVFTIQNKFVDTLFELNPKLTDIENQPFQAFQAIWESEWIEESPLTSPQTPSIPYLFQSNKTFMYSISEFYRIFWRRADHDRPAGAPPPTQDEVRDSVYREYAKRRLWDSIDGNNRQMFRNVIEAYEDSIQGIIDQCRKIYNKHILTTVDVLNTHYFIIDAKKSEDDKKYCIVLDQLVHWLIRGTCYMITGNVVSLLTALDALQNTQLLQTDEQFFLSKPGLVQFFKTVEMVYQKLDDLLNEYIAFSNPFDNIHQTITVSKYNVKHLYNNYYRGHIHSWLEEIHNLFGIRKVSLLPIMSFHLLSGTAFLISYINNFRKLVYHTRRTMTRYRHERRLIMQITHNAYRRTYDECFNWFRNLNHNELLHPFNVVRWETHLGTEITRMDAMDFSYLRMGAGPLVP